MSVFEKITIITNIDLAACGIIGVVLAAIKK